MTNEGSYFQDMSGRSELRISSGMLAIIYELSIMPIIGWLSVKNTQMMPVPFLLGLKRFIIGVHGEVC